MFQNCLVNTPKYSKLCMYRCSELTFSFLLFLLGLDTQIKIFFWRSSSQIQSELKIIIMYSRYTSFRARPFQRPSLPYPHSTALGCIILYPWPSNALTWCTVLQLAPQIGAGSLTVFKCLPKKSFWVRMLNFCTLHPWEPFFQMPPAEGA